MCKQTTDEWNVLKNAQPKCIHCGEGHPANYRECIVAKEMQKLKNKNIKKAEGPDPQQRKITEIHHQQ